MWMWQDTGRIVDIKQRAPARTVVLRSKCSSIEITDEMLTAVGENGRVQRYSLTMELVAEWVSQGNDESVLHSVRIIPRSTGARGRFKGGKLFARVWKTEKSLKASLWLLSINRDAASMLEYSSSEFSLVHDVAADSELSAKLGDI